MAVYIAFLALTTFAWAGAVQSSSDTGGRLQELSDSAAVQQRQGDYKAAELSYREILKLRPGLPEALSNLGLMLHLQGEFEAAIECFGIALKARPGMLVPNLFSGTALTRLGRAREAIPFLRRAVAIAPNDAQALYQLAQAFGSSGDFDRAKVSYAEALRIDAGNADAWFGLGISYLKLGQLASERLAKLAGGKSYAHALLADALIEQGQAERAVQIYLQLRDAHAPLPCAQSGLGRAYLRLGKTAEATAAFSAQSDRSKHCPDGPLPQRSGKFLECARKLSDQIAQLNASELLNLASCAYYADRAEWTFSATERLMKAKPNSPEMLYWRAEAAQKLALAALSEAGRKAPDSHKMHLLLGDTYRAKNHAQEAIQEYRRALALQPSDLGGHWGLARTYYQALEYEDALAELRTVLHARPEDSEANYMAGRMLVATRRMEEAESYLKRAVVGTGAHVPHAHALLSSVYAGRGEQAAAIAELKKSLEADEDGSYHLRIYMLYKQSGDTAAASRALAEAKALRTKQAAENEAPSAFDVKWPTP